MEKKKSILKWEDMVHIRINDWKMFEGNIDQGVANIPFGA